MADEHDVRIVGWPEEPARLTHQFRSEEPCPVSVQFNEAPANVVIHTNPGERIDVDMAMNLRVKDVLPVCIKMCEPLCAKSEYVIGITIFDRPVATITVSGLTRLFNCRDREV